MKTPYDYLVAPQGGRYKNVKKIEGVDLILNTTMDETDFKYTNRLGTIIGTPKRKGILKKGDEVIVHHNTFRKWFNVKGKLKDSANYIKEGHFYVGYDQIFAYRRDGGEWIATEDYCFVEAIPETQKTLLSRIKKQYSETEGYVFINNPILEEQGVEKGDKVLFPEVSAYRFEIEGKMLYKMSARNSIQAKLWI